MSTLTRTTVLALLASFSFVALSGSPVIAAQPNALLLPPQDDFYLPKFGFSSFNIHGVGERVTSVHWGGRAARLGLERGDVILSMNGFRLSYDGSWNDALHRAVLHGGLVRLKVRDVRTGQIAFRQTYIGGSGPIVPKHYVGDYNDYNGPNTSHVIHHHPNHKNNVQKIKQLVELFD